MLGMGIRVLIRTTQPIEIFCSISFFMYSIYYAPIYNTKFEFGYVNYRRKLGTIKFSKEYTFYHSYKRTFQAVESY